MNCGLIVIQSHARVAIIAARTKRGLRPVGMFDKLTLNFLVMHFMKDTDRFAIHLQLSRIELSPGATARALRIKFALALW